MKAVQMHAFGEPDVLKFEDIDRPSPGPGQVLVEIRAASVNPLDWKIREGGHPAVGEDDLPFVPGRDIAGRIVELGAGVRHVGLGQPVFAYLDRQAGGYGDYALVDARLSIPKPRTLTMTQAAAVPLAAVSAGQGLIDYGALQRGQRVLIHGGAGGIGHLAIQIAKVRGAWVATTVAPEDLDFVRRLGADQAVDYRSERFEEVVAPVDLVFDLVGGETQQRSFNVVVSGGRLVSTVSEPDAGTALARGVMACGFMARPNGVQLYAISHLIEHHMLRVEVQRTFALSRAAEAQIFQKNQHSRGKTVLEVRH